MSETAISYGENAGTAWANHDDNDEAFREKAALALCRFQQKLISSEHCGVMEDIATFSLEDDVSSTSGLSQRWWHMFRNFMPVIEEAILPQYRRTEGQMTSGDEEDLSHDVYTLKNSHRKYIGSASIDLANLPRKKPTVRL